MIEIFQNICPNKGNFVQKAKSKVWSLAIGVWLHLHFHFLQMPYPFHVTRLRFQTLPLLVVVCNAALRSVSVWCSKVIIQNVTTNSNR